MSIVSSRIGGVFDGPVLVESFQTGTTKRGSLYASLQLRDEEGTQAKGVLWSYEESDAPLLQPGKVISLIAARVNEYQGNKQLVIEHYDVSDKDPMDFARKTEGVEEKLDKIRETIESFESEDVKNIAKALLFEKRAVVDKFMKAPAATGVHNNWFGGLIEHVVSMIDIAEGVVSHYKKSYAHYLKRDYVMFGIIFHDLGKIIEYETDNPAFDRTAEGHLVNHIVMGPAWIYHEGVKAKANSRTIMDLMHLVASHHGCNDWGSPVKPVTLEAILLHHIDNMDSKFMHAWDLQQNTAECAKGMTKKSWVEGTRFISQKELPDEEKPPIAGDGLTRQPDPTITETDPPSRKAVEVGSKHDSGGGPNTPTPKSADPTAVW